MDSQTYFTPYSRRDGFLCNGHSVPFPRSSCAPIKLPSSPRSSVYTPTHAGFCSRGVCPHFSARRCAHGLCVNRAQADPSLMRRERLNRPSSAALQCCCSECACARVIPGSTGSLEESLICILAQDSGNSVRCSECRLMLYSKWCSVGQACQSLYNV